MNERWVCKRCFADNDEGQPACARCGLARGAEAPPDEQSAWAGTAEPGSGGRDWRRWIRFWWVPVLGVVLLVGYLTTARRDDGGALTTAGNVAVDDLRTGDCFNSADAGEISEVHGVPCGEPHEYEVFAVGDYGAENAAFPSDAEMELAFGAVCEPAFEPYVGTPYATSAIFGSMITPSEGSWSDGDRQFVCVLYEPDPDDPQASVVLTESLRGAGR